MINPEQAKKIQEKVREFFRYIGIEGNLTMDQREEQGLFFNFQTEEPRILIGQQGQTLLEIQHLLRLVLRKDLPAGIFLDLDINDYKKKKTEYLQDLAKEIADQVALSKRAESLPPMPAYERRVIHLALTERKDVKTESEGEEPERKVVIKPCLN